MGRVWTFVYVCGDGTVLPVSRGRGERWSMLDLRLSYHAQATCAPKKPLTGPGPRCHHVDCGQDSTRTRQQILVFRGNGSSNKLPNPCPMWTRLLCVRTSVLPVSVEHVSQRSSGDGGAGAFLLGLLTMGEKPATINVGPMSGWLYFGRIHVGAPVLSPTCGHVCQDALRMMCCRCADLPHPCPICR